MNAEHARRPDGGRDLHLRDATEEGGSAVRGDAEDWVASGRLVDLHEELLIKESKFINHGTLEMDYMDKY